MLKLSLCNIKREFYLEFVREDEVIKRFFKGGWVIKQDSFMLDIDLDFFGIIYVFQFFLDVGMFIVFLNMMNGVFWKLFCLKIVKEE